MDIITLNSTNIEKEHICCAIADKKSETGVQMKKKWLNSRFQEGLKFKRLDARGKVFIEYLPAENAWVPVEAPGYILINCHWVSGSFKGQGWGTKLLQACEEDAQGTNGIVLISASKKKPFLSDKSFFVKNGFDVCDKAGEYFELLVKKFKPEASTPKFSEKSKSLSIGDVKGIDIFCTPQCPFAINYAEFAYGWASDMGVTIRLHEFTSKEEARNHPCPVTSYSVFQDGKFVTQEILSKGKLEKLVKGEW